ncbi:hypothetical protein CesoFtcFv8_012931 [Champsocephalus esox]|uniref:Uncharacterized protein n=1 Tax=Champsocephalus esox TaxID=159716 RepID=A0AAN8GVK5_9TELE|nr:hypothetical protein CesoFtcFv8_012931 [Champsocephalus esox]
MPQATPLKKKKVKKSKMEPDAVDEEGLVSPAETTAEEKKKGKKGKKGTVRRRCSLRTNQQGAMKRKKRSQRQQTPLCSRRAKRRNVCGRN